MPNPAPLSFISLLVGRVHGKEVTEDGDTLLLQNIQYIWIVERNLTTLLSPLFWSWSQGSVREILVTFTLFDAHAIGISAKATDKEEYSLILQLRTLDILRYYHREIQHVKKWSDTNPSQRV